MRSEIAFDLCDEALAIDTRGSISPATFSKLRTRRQLLARHGDPGARRGGNRSLRSAMGTEAGEELPEAARKGNTIRREINPSRRDHSSGAAAWASSRSRR